MTLLRDGCPRRARDTNADACAFSPRDAADLKETAEQRGAFAHAKQSHRFVVRDIGPFNAAAVVLDFQAKPAVGLAQPDGDLGRPGVTDHIRERFLENAEQGGAQVVVKRLVNLGPDIALDSSAVLELVRLPFERRRQTKMVEHAGAQFG